MTEDFGLLFEFLFYASIFYICWLVFRRPQPDIDTRSYTSGSGREYRYTIGDNMYSYDAYGNFNGIDIQLPIEMPHIYLDSRVGGGHKVNAIFDSSQLLQLEGNFNKTFNVFVPKKYEDVALSVLTPDVMECLQRYAADFDVEIYGSHLRVITDKKVLKDSAVQDNLFEVAGKLLVEIEGRARSWPFTNSVESIDQDLLVYPARGIRLFGRYMAWKRFWITIFWLMAVAPFFALAIVLFYMHNLKGAWVFLGVGILVFAALQAFTSRGMAESRFHSRQKDYMDEGDDGGDN